MPRCEAPNARVTPLHHSGFAYDCRVTEAADPATEPVVLLGGFIQDKDSWRLHELMINKWATTVAPDLPGSGTADPLPPEYGVDFLAETLGHTLDRLAIPRVNVIGYSFGALVAHSLAHHQPHRVARLALAGMARPKLVPQEEIEAFAALRRAIVEGDREEFVRRAVAMLIVGNGMPRVRKTETVEKLLAHQLRGLSRDAMDRYLAHTDRVQYAHDTIGASSRAELEGVPLEVPTLVFTGESDMVTPPGHSREFAGSCKNGRFTTIKGCGHMVMLERTGEFTGLLHRFFTDGSLDDLPYCNPVE